MYRGYTGISLSVCPSLSQSVGPSVYKILVPVEAGGGIKSLLVTALVSISTSLTLCYLVKSLIGTCGFDPIPIQS